jgi:hypothetical protein
LKPTLQHQRLPLHDSNSIRDPIARVENDSISRQKPFSDFDCETVPLTDADGAQLRASLCGEEHGPIFALPELGA